MSGISSRRIFLRVRMPVKANAGFTLIELMIVITVVGILLAIAIPTYQNFIYRARRADGKNLLQQVAAAEERYYTNNNAYTANMAAGGLGLGASATSASSAKGYYLLQANLPTPLTYTLTATPQGAQVGDLCGALTLTNTGVKGPTSAAANGNGTCL